MISLERKTGGRFSRAKGKGDEKRQEKKKVMQNWKKGKKRKPGVSRKYGYL